MCCQTWRREGCASILFPFPVRHSFCLPEQPPHTLNPLFTLLCPLSALWAQIERELRNGPLVTARQRWALPRLPRAWGDLAIALLPLSHNYLPHIGKRAHSFMVGEGGTRLIMIPLIKQATFL